jgi:dihydrofolate reductase
VVGPRQFDQTKGWGGSHPMGTPVFVVTHEAPADWVNTDTPFTFVTDGVDSAVAQAKVVAGSKNVGVGPGSIVGQALQAGLIDELRMDLVPITLGGGTRMLEDLTKNPQVVGDPPLSLGSRTSGWPPAARWTKQPCPCGVGRGRRQVGSRGAWG